MPTRYFPSISGGEFYIQRIAEIIKEKYNYHIDVYTSNAIDFKALREPSGKKITEDHKLFHTVNELPVYRFPVDYELDIEKEITFLMENEFNNLSNISEMCLRKILKNGPYTPDLLKNVLNASNPKYDIVHTTFYPYFNIYYSLIIGKFLKIPVVITPFFHFANPRYDDSDLIEILKEFDLIIACTQIEKDHLKKKINIPDCKFKIIPMGVDYNVFEEIHKTKFINYSFKEKFFNEKEKKYKMVLFCGYKNYEKGAISILKAIPLVIKKISKVYFVFIGPPTEAFNRELSKIHKIKNVKIINFTPANLNGYFDKKKLTAFKETDIFIMPSRSDAYGIAFLEAWASGKPVIGANSGATPEVIRENIDGMLVEFDDPQDLSKKIITLLKKPKLREKLGKAGKLKVAQDLTWEKIADKTHTIYQTLINNLS